jgi:hypothetical protein
MDELKPCPFCGREVSVYSSSRSYSFVFSHKGLRNCPFFQFEIMWHDAKSLKEATEWWNRRAKPQIESEG